MVIHKLDIACELEYVGQRLYHLDRGLNDVSERKVSENQYRQFNTNYNIANKIVEGIKNDKSLKLNRQDSQRLVVQEAILSTLLRKIESLDVSSKLKSDVALSRLVA